jgi:hypothetical protein
MVTNGAGLVMSTEIASSGDVGTVPVGVHQVARGIVPVAGGGEELRLAFGAQR